MTTNRPILRSITRIRRFKVNPVELAIFSAVSLVFFNSVYSFFYEWTSNRTPSVETTADVGTDSPESVVSVAAIRDPNLADPFLGNPRPLKPAFLHSESLPESGRSPASITRAPFLNLEVPCTADFAPVETVANKVRLNGAFCYSAKDAPVVEKAEIYNQSNQVMATVFMDALGKRYSTDYFTLSSGKNTISMKFVFKGGKTFTQDVIVNQKQ